MRAAIHTRYGPPTVVKVQEVAIPVPGPNEVLIKVHATTVNRTDCGFRSAEYFISRFWSGLLRPKQQILGGEFAGTIEQVGEQVQDWRTSDHVFGYDDVRFGGHAEYLVQPSTANMATIPDGMSFTEAAPMLEGSHYALCALRAARVEAGQRIMVYGATGAIGSAAVQLANHFGAHVTAVCDTNTMGLVRSLGADVVIDRHAGDPLAGQGPFHLVFDAVGKISFRLARPLLKPKGIYISTELGKRGENIPLALFTPLFGGKQVLFPIPTIDKKDVEFFKEMAASGKFSPVIDRTYSLENIVEAYRFVETGQKVGNVVIEVG